MGENIENSYTALVLRELQVTVTSGLTSDEVNNRRATLGGNVVDPPIVCPAWICCLLPCIQHIPSMKAYRQIVPEDAEVKRNGRWIRYDAISLVKGDIIRLEDGDVVPADCFVLNLEPGCAELLVDHRLVTGPGEPLSVTPTSFTQDEVEGNDRHHRRRRTLFWGGRVVLGACVAVCTAVGPQTAVAQAIARKEFPMRSSSGGAIDTGAFPTNENSAAEGDAEQLGMMLIPVHSSNKSEP